MQEEVFAKAKAAMQEELKDQEEPETRRHEECVVEEKEVNLKAKAEAESFMNKEKCKYENLSMEQAYLVYKFVFISEELMVKGLMGMPKDILSQAYRSIAKQLHPDKNSHPQAKEAFQRVQSAMETVKARIPVQLSTLSAAHLTSGAGGK